MDFPIFPTFAIMNRRIFGFEINRDLAINCVTIQKIPLDHLALVSKGNDKFVDAMSHIDFMMCQGIGLPPISHSVSEDNSFLRSI